MSYIIKPGKNSAWRKHVLSNLAADTIIYGKIRTGLPMAKDLTKLLAKLISWAKENTLHSRRLALRYLVNKKNIKINDEKIKIISKLFELGEKYQNRLGGYTRIIKSNSRRGDNSLRVIFSLV